MDRLKFRCTCTFIIYHNIISIKSKVFFFFILHKTYITRSCLCQNSVEIPSNRYNSMYFVNYLFLCQACQFAISAVTSRVWVRVYHLSHQVWSSSYLYASHNADWIMWLIWSMEGPAEKLILASIKHTEDFKYKRKNKNLFPKKIDPTIFLNDQYWAFAPPITTSYCLWTVTVWCCSGGIPHINRSFLALEHRDEYTYNLLQHSILEQLIH